MHFKIHRGTQEIGRSCVEIWTESTRIVLDIGMLLVEKDGSEFVFQKYKTFTVEELINKEILPNIDGFYANANKLTDAMKNETGIPIEFYTYEYPAQNIKYRSKTDVHIDLVGDIKFNKIEF